MLAEAERAVSQASNSKGSDARVIGLNLFAAVITEFAPSTASAMQLPWDFHERCRVSLQNDFLQQFFQHAVGTARAAAEKDGQKVDQATPGDPTWHYLVEEDIAAKVEDMDIGK